MNSSDTPRPKPAPPKAKTLVGNATPPAENEKPKFVRRPHLTERPFKAHEGLAALRKQMDKVTPSQSRANKEKK